MDKELRDALDDLVEKSLVINAELDAVSDQIREAEEAFKSLNVNHTFKWKVPEEKAEMLWCNFEGSYRICLRLGGHNGAFFIKPFIMHKAAIRAQYIKHLIGFIHAFGEHIGGQKFLDQRL